MEGDTPEKFYQYYKSFLQDIIVAFPELKEKITENHASLLRTQYPISEKKKGKCDKFRKTVFEFIIKNGKLISEKDSSLFLGEDINTSLARNMDFKAIWESNISDTSREQLWNYLQTFYMLAVSESTNSDISTLFKNFNEVVDGKDNEEMVDHLKNITENMLSTMKEPTEENLDEINTQADKMKTEFEGIFSGSIIGDLANDISKELDIEKMVGSSNNPQDIIGNLFGAGGGDGPNIMSIVENIGKSINDKVQSGELNEMKLIHEAQNIMGNLQNNDMFSGLAEQFSAMNAPQPPRPSRPINPTQERLQKKLNEKKK